MLCGTQAFEIFSKDHATLRKIGFAYADQGDTRAIQFLKAVFQADPTDFMAANMLTKMYVEVDLNEAERWGYVALSSGGGEDAGASAHRVDDCSGTRPWRRAATSRRTTSGGCSK